jgi:uncharacterized protein DUF222
MVAAKMSTTELMAEAMQLNAQVQSALGALMSVIGEIDRREAWRVDGATSMANWLSQKCGVAEATGRVWAQLAERLWDLPVTAAAFEAGEVTLDKVRAILPVATPETDAATVEAAKSCSVRDLNEIARSRESSDDIDPSSEYEGRYLRFNDHRRTISARLDREHYALVRNRLEHVARKLPIEVDVRWDQRLADALIIVAGSGIPNEPSDTSPVPTLGLGYSGNHLLVVHADLSYLKGEEGNAEIERLGLIGRETVERIACDARVVLAIDDDVGHTMYEGRSRRSPSDTQRREVWRRDRTCRFPGCSNSVFTTVHHIFMWIKGGLTDLPNLVLLCDHHHHLIHSNQWSMEGDANEELRFAGPTGETMTSRPSLLWGRSKSGPAGPVPPSG